MQIDDSTFRALLESLNRMLDLQLRPPPMIFTPPMDFPGPMLKRDSVAQDVARIDSLAKSVDREEFKRREIESDLQLAFERLATIENYKHLFGDIADRLSRLENQRDTEFRLSSLATPEEHREQLIRSQRQEIADLLTVLTSCLMRIRKTRIDDETRQALPPAETELEKKVYQILTEKYEIAMTPWVGF